MLIPNERLRAIHIKTDGCCHLCHRKLSFTNYGKRNTKGAWQIEHSIPKANGVTNHLNNLFAACICCNHEKGARHTQTIRKRNDVTRAPYSKVKKEKIKEENTLAGMISGGLIGTGFGPAGTLAGVIIGGILGESISPNR